LPGNFARIKFGRPRTPHRDMLDDLRSSLNDRYEVERELGQGSYRATFSSAVVIDAGRDLVLASGL